MTVSLVGMLDYLIFHPHYTSRYCFPEILVYNVCTGLRNAERSPAWISSQAIRPIIPISPNNARKMQKSAQNNVKNMHQKHAN